MNRGNGEEVPRATLEKIELDLATYKILLHFQGHKEPLVLHFDKPARRFYFALIALIVTEMKNLGKPGFIHIRRHEETLKLLDHSLAGRYASETPDGIWDKIRKAWRYILPDLETGTHFKILDRDLIPPYEKGGKYRYECSDEECDACASLFDYDENNPWRFKFAVDSVSLDLKDVSLKLGDLRDNEAWQGFVKGLSAVEELADEGVIEVRERAKSRWWYRAAVAAVAILIIVAAVITIRNPPFPPSPPPPEIELPDKPSIVVLPFANISEDPKQEYFSDGITEELINILARLEGLRVISRTSSFICKEKNLDIKTIGEKLKVDHVLEGGVRKSGNKLRITAQLVKVADDAHLWAATYDGEMEDIFAIQEEISQVIVDKLKVKLLGREVRVKRSTKNPEAYILYIKGRFFWNQSTREGNKKALVYFEKALTVDPNFSLAYAGLSDVYQQLAFSRSSHRTETYTKAKSMAMQALEIDNNLAEAHASLGLLKYRYEWDWNGAEKALKRAIELNPSCVVAHRYYSGYLRAVGRLDEALEGTKRALELDPLSDHINRHLGIVFRCRFQVDEAIEQFKKALEMQPNNTNTLTLLGNTYVQKGMHEEGIAALQKVLNISPNNPFALGFLGGAYALAGKKEKSQKILEKLLERSKRMYFSSYFVAMIYTHLGEKDKAFEWLEKAYVERDPIMFPIKTVPDFESLRSGPRWMALLKRMGLEE